MKAIADPVLAIFEKKMQLEVPLFQRQYVWSRSQQWEPLWEDIARKFNEFLDGRHDAPVHFLGAIVLDQRQTPTTHVERRQIIDGQQRLTTLQIFLAAFRDFCAAAGSEELAKECETFTVNTGRMAAPEVEQFKVWPTQLDRPMFTTVMTAKSHAELIKRHPLQRPKYARKPLPRPRLVECYLFFYEQLREMFVDVQGPEDIDRRLDACFQALRNTLQVVVIDLEQGDDAQVIFRILNARGEPLLPADLLRNYIFLRAARRKEPQVQLYEKYWREFDTDFWRKHVSQGQLYRPRSDMFIGHFLASKQAIDVPLSHLYVEYRHWIEKSNPFPSVEEELKELQARGLSYKSMLEGSTDGDFYPLTKFLNSFDIGTVYPLLLFFDAAGFSVEERDLTGRAIKSYLLRRAVCGLATNNYNRVFLRLIRALQRGQATSTAAIDYLLDLRGETVEWPSDETFAQEWSVGHAYLVSIIRSWSTSLPD